MTNTVQAYPLQWPLSIKRTPSIRREYARFSRKSTSEHGWARRDRLTIAQARKRLRKELDIMGARNVVLSSNMRLRLDNEPRSGQPEPQDPGVAVYWTYKGEQKCMPCDRWNRAADNIAAIAAAIGALRGLNRWVNASVVNAAFSGFTALPSPETFASDWRAILGFEPLDMVTVVMVKEAYRVAAGVAHPDKGGSTEQMSRVNMARANALEAINNE